MRSLTLAGSERPTIVTVIDHLPGHAAVYADVLSGDEPCFFAAEEQYHACNVHRVTHAATKLLCGIGTFVNCAGGINPTG